MWYTDKYLHTPADFEVLQEGAPLVQEIASTGVVPEFNAVAGSFNNLENTGDIGRRLEDKFDAIEAQRDLFKSAKSNRAKAREERKNSHEPTS